MISIRTICVGSGLSLALAAGTGVAVAQHDHNGAHTPAATQPIVTAPASDPYLLSTDPVTGKPLGDSPVIHRHEGRELRFTDAKSLDTFKHDPAKYLPAVDRQMIQQQLAHYPLDVCLVAGGKLGSMGEPMDYLYRNRLVRFCCAGCVGGFEKDAAKHLARLDAAVIEKQKKEYPTDTCVVSGDKLGGDMGEVLDYVVGNRLIRLCCKGCVRDLLKAPAAYLAKLDALVKPKAEQGHERPAPKDAGDRGEGHRGHQH